MGYKPPYSITDYMVDSVSLISEKIGEMHVKTELASKPQLRKNSRISSIHSSLAIEANSLSLGQVRDVINGHSVIGPQKEIQEVKNAYAAYEMIGKLDPYSVDDMLEAHGMMTRLTVKESGAFRSGGEGVFDENGKCIFMAPPALQVPGLVSDLFDWMKESSELNPLIISSVFHYELVFIHPFSDGNGRMARLWQTVILSRWKEIFQFVPIENQIRTRQAEYYKAIAECNDEGNSNRFIEFMLKMMNQALDELQRSAKREDGVFSLYVKRLLSAMDFDVPYTANEILEKLNLKSKETLRKNYLSPALENGLIRMTEPDRSTSRNQRYVKE